VRRAMLLILLLAASAHAQSELELLVEQLGSKDFTNRNLAYQALRKRKNSRVIGLLIEAAPNYSETAQHYAVMLIAMYPPKQHGPALRRLAKSESPHLRISAAVTLYQLGDRKMLPLIVAVLTSKGLDEATLGSVAMRVRPLRNPEVYAAIRALLTKERSVMNIYGMFDGFSLVGYAGATPEAKAIIAGDSRSGPQAVAATYLVVNGRAQYAKDLAAIIAAGGVDLSSFARVRSQLARARLYPANVIEAVLERAPAETNASLLVSMIQFISEGSKRADTRSWLEDLLKHKEGRIVVAAIEALERLRASPDKDALTKLLQHEDDERALIAARILRRLDDQSGLERTIRIVRTNKAQRNLAVAALGEFRRAEAVEPLIEMLSDSDSNVRNAAAFALYRTLDTLFPYRRFEMRLAYYYAAPEAERSASIEKIRTWWNTNKNGGP